jgi:hypothetical protein
MRSYIFRNSDEAASYLTSIVQDGKMAGLPSRRGGGALSLGLPPFGSYAYFDGAASANGGVPLYVSPASSTRRESWLMGAQPAIYQHDLDHLMARDPVTRAIVGIPVRNTWGGVPRAFDATVDGFLEDVHRLGWMQAAISADMAQRRSIPGISFVHIVAGGDPATHIEESGGLWSGFQVIRASDIDWLETTFNPGDPDLAPFFIERLAVVDAEGNSFRIHGTRLIAFHDDLESRAPQACRPILYGLHDTLWRRRDIEFMQAAAQVEGNPIVVSIDPNLLEKGLDRVRLKPEEEDATMQDIADVRSGATDAIGILRAITVKRVGKIELEDPEWALRAVVGSLAVDCDLTANSLMVFSRGSEQITDADRNDIQDRTEMRRRIHAWPRLARLFRLAQLSGYVAKRRARFPLELRWPFIRRLNEREEAFVLSRNAATLREAREAGRIPPAYVAEQFPADPDAFPVMPTRSGQRLDQEEAKRQQEMDAAEAELDGQPPSGQ